MNRLKKYLARLIKLSTEASFGGAGGPSPPQGKRRKKKRKTKKKKEKKREKRKKGTMNNVILLHIKCCFFQFFNSPVALKNKKILAPQEKVEMTPLVIDLNNIAKFGLEIF